MIMWGEPDDHEGACNARCFIGDNYGDGAASMICQLPPNHEGQHQEKFGGRNVTVTWEVDERRKCDHSCGCWDHESYTIHEAAGCPIHTQNHDPETCHWCNPGATAEECPACKMLFYPCTADKRHYTCSAEPEQIPPPNSLDTAHSMSGGSDKLTE